MHETLTEIVYHSFGTVKIPSFCFGSKFKRNKIVMQDTKNYQNLG